MQAGRLLLAARGVAPTAEALAGATLEAENLLMTRAYYMGPK